MGGACSTHGSDEKYVQNFDRKLEGKRPLGRTKLRWEDDIGMNLRETGWEGMDWIHLA
jgi:hypothetical protein